MYYLLLYDLAPNYLEKRTAHRSLHFDHVNAALSRGEFVMGGAFDPADQAALLFKVDDIGIIEEFAKTDPYVKAGVATNWTIKKWTVVIGG